MHTSALGPGIRDSPTLMPTKGPFLWEHPALASDGRKAIRMRPIMAHARPYPACLLCCPAEDLLAMPSFPRGSAQLSTRDEIPAARCSAM
eukprot:629584-Heterocapsa_arctica.AAC.1